MFLLATALLFGWPKLEVEFGAARPLREGEFFVRANECCGSMKPAIVGGELLIASRWDGREKLLGRIVDNGIALHQVVAENKRAIKTAGLANRQSDSWSPKSSVRYVIRQIVRP